MLLTYTQLGNQQEKSPIVILHGLFGSKENLNIIAKPLAQDNTVINVDLRNHGNSFHSVQMNYSLMANDVFNLLDELGINTCRVIGHSMGGKVAMQMALNNEKRIEKLIVLDIAPTTYGSRHQQIFNGLKCVNLEQLTNRSEADDQLKPFIPEQGVRQFLLKSLVKVENEFQWKFNLHKIIESYEHILAKPEGSAYLGPTLFIKGANSDYITEQYRPDIASMFPAARAKIIAGAGHWLHAEKPSHVNQAISAFLS
jgi:esterase